MQWCNWWLEEGDILILLQGRSLKFKLRIREALVALEWVRVSLRELSLVVAASCSVEKEAGEKKESERLSKGKT